MEEDFNNALENFENTQGEDLTYQVLLKSNPNLKAYFKELIEKNIIINLILLIYFCLRIKNSPKLKSMAKVFYDV